MPISHAHYHLPIRWKNPQPGEIYGIPEVQITPSLDVSGDNWSTVRASIIAESTRAPLDHLEHQVELGASGAGISSPWRALLLLLLVLLFVYYRMAV